jgi:hypothetical protein
MLTKLDSDLERTNDKMIAIDNSMKRLIEKSDQKLLWGILCCEVVALIIICVV